MLRISYRFFSRWHPLRRLAAILLTVALSLTFIHLLHPQWPATPVVPVFLAEVPPVPPPLPDAVTVDGAAYHPFIPTPAAHAAANRTVRPLRALAAISDACLDKWISTGLWQHPCTPAMATQDPTANRIDLVYMWVNGSDPVHQAQRTAHRTPLAKGEKPPAAARFREHDELRYSLRAARNATRRWPGGTIFHIVTGDVESPLELGEDQGQPQQRLGLVPQWLDLECALGGGGSAWSFENGTRDAQVEGNRTVDGEELLQPAPAPPRSVEPKIRFHHHSELFRLSTTPETPLSANATQALRNASEWLERTVPSFNSFAIESQLAHLDPEVVSDQIIALNDDQFLSLPFPPHAFHSPLYGPVFRLGTLLVDPDPRGEEDGGGEWRALHWTAWVLDQRFGARKRPYVLHYARALSLPLLHELALALPTFWDFTPLSRFRGQHERKGEFEVNTIFAATHYIVERHREALLWSWVVGKWGGGPHSHAGSQAGILDRNKKRAMWAELGGQQGKESVTLRRRERVGVEDMGVNLVMAGLIGDEEEHDVAVARGEEAGTIWRWLSTDGYAASYRGVARSTSIKRGECISDRVEDAWDMFRRVVKEKPACGDQIIAALMRTSTRGLSVFLPPPSAPSNSNSTSSSASQQTQSQNPLTLPLSLPLHAPSFPPNPRAFAIRLLARYAYAVADTPSVFVALESGAQARRVLRTAEENGKAAFLCVNDDLPESVGREEGEEVDGLLRGWFERRWGERGGCEVG
ncbi:hypothetical protein C8R46DRAFT_1346882 [Mycena filopes]|nr:hypothetical protein C8R46DRAFT_1346882 [Mycena filopes]